MKLVESFQAKPNKLVLLYFLHPILLIGILYFNGISRSSCVICRVADTSTMLILASVYAFLMGVLPIVLLYFASRGKKILFDVINAIHVLGVLIILITLWWPKWDFYASRYVTNWSPFGNAIATIAVLASAVFFLILFLQIQKRMYVATASAASTIPYKKQKPPLYVAGTHYFNIIVYGGIFGWLVFPLFTWLVTTESLKQIPYASQALTLIISFLISWVAIAFSARNSINRWYVVTDKKQVALYTLVIQLVVSVLFSGLGFFINIIVQQPALSFIAPSNIISIIVSLLVTFGLTYWYLREDVQIGDITTIPRPPASQLSKWLPGTIFMLGLLLNGYYSVGEYQKTSADIKSKMPTMEDTIKTMEIERRAQEALDAKTILQYNQGDLHFSYPGSWKELLLLYSNGSNSYTFVSSGSNYFGFIVYHRPTNSFVVHELGNEVATQYDGNSNRIAMVKIIAPDGSEKTIWTMPTSTAALFNRISDMSVSPNLDYIAFNIKALHPPANSTEKVSQELTSTDLLEVSTGKDILANTGISFDGMYGTMMWNADSTKLVIRNGGTDRAGGNAIYASIGWPITGFKKFFELTNEEYNSGLRIHMVNYGTELQFLVTTDQYAITNGPPDKSQIKATYRYNFEEDSLTKLP